MTSLGLGSSPSYDLRLGQRLCGHNVLVQENHRLQIEQISVFKFRQGSRMSHPWKIRPLHHLSGRRCQSSWDGNGNGKKFKPLVPDFLKPPLWQVPADCYSCFVKKRCASVPKQLVDSLLIWSFCIVFQDRWGAAVFMDEPTSLLLYLVIRSCNIAEIACTSPRDQSSMAPNQPEARIGLALILTWWLHNGRSTQEQEVNVWGPFPRVTIRRLQFSGEQTNTCAKLHP